MDPISILVPVDEQTEPALLALAHDLLGARGGTVTVLAVVEMPPGRQPGAGATAARAARRSLRRLSAAAAQSGAEVRALVRAARTLAAGIREVAEEERPDLLVLSAPPGGTVAPALRDLVAAPPCDLVVARSGGAMHEPGSVLVAARGGPTAELALSLAQNVATRRGAQLTLLHVDAPGRSMAERTQEERLFRSLLAQSAYPRLRTSVLPAADVAATLLAEAERHQVTVIGAAGHPAAAQELGTVADSLLARAPGAVLVVKPRRMVDPSVFVPRPATDAVVDRWFAENTFHCREFADIDELVRLKRAQGCTVSVALMPAGDAGTLSAIARVVRDELGRRAGLVDEVVLFDDGRRPSLAPAARESGLHVHTLTSGERGRAVWESLQVLRGDLVVWLDSDLRNIHAKFVYGLVGPLLREHRIALVTGFYRLPETLADAAFDDGQLSTTELAVRPLLNLYYAELSGMINPLARERAARREALTGVRLRSGPGADIALVLDVYERAGVWAEAQSDLEERVGQPVPVAEVTRRAFGAVQALAGRVTARDGAGRAAHAAMKLIRRDGERYFIELVDAAETALPPITPARTTIGSLPGT